MTEILETVTDLTGTEEQGFLHLSRTERFIAAGICALCAVTAGILSIVAIFILNMRKFVVLFTVSSLLYVISLSLLIGFKKICASCFDKKRIYSGVGMMTGMFIVLFFGLVKKWIILSIIGFVIEFISFVYYALSFIPGGEQIFHFLLF